MDRAASMKRLVNSGDRFSQVSGEVILKDCAMERIKGTATKVSVMA
jgi:hypothetical protein